MDEYEKFLRGKLGQLQAETASVQHSLDMYLAFKAKQTRGIAGPASSSDQATEPAAKPAGARAVNKTAFVMDFLRDAGQDGATGDAVWDEVKRGGLDMSRDHLRSILWHGVKDKKISKGANNVYHYIKKEPVASTTGSIFESRG